MQRTRTKVIVYVCGGVVLASFALSAWTFVRQGQADAVRTADEKARAVSQVESCRQQVASLPRVLRILELVDVLATNSILANQQALETSPPTDALTPIRQASLRRLLPARADLRRYVKETKHRAPTRASCNRLADELGVTKKGAQP